MVLSCFSTYVICNFFYILEVFIFWKSLYLHSVYVLNQNYFIFRTLVFKYFNMSRNMINSILTLHYLKFIITKNSLQNEKSFR
jgi:hypothetical protein